MAFLTSLMVLLALVVPLVGTAGATHTSADITRIDAGADDTAPANTCNAFTVSAFGDPGAARPAEFETIDIRATQQDNNDITRDIEIAFCDPDGNGPGSNLTGPVPTQASGAQTGTAANVQPGRDCDDDAPVSTDGSDGGACNNGAGTAELPASIHDECMTDANGQCTFGIISSEAGTMNVQVFSDTGQGGGGVDNDTRDGTEFFDNVVKTWSAGAGATRNITCTPASDFNPEGTRHEFQCTVTDASGTAIGGQSVTFDVTAGPNSQEIGPTNCGGAQGAATATSTSPQTSQTNNQGQTPAPATEQGTGGQSPAAGPAGNRNANACGYDDPGGVGNVDSPPGQDTIVAYVNLPQQPGGGVPTSGVDAGEPSVTITKTWVGPSRTIDCEPETASNLIGTTHTVTCTVRDRAGNPAQGVWVELFIVAGPGQFTRQPANVTNAQGQVVGTLTTGTQEGIGTTTIRGEIEPPSFLGAPPQSRPAGQNRAECGQPAGTPQGAPAGVCLDDVNKEWTRQGAPQCNDNVDNDGDGRIDYPDDPDCAGLEDNSEAHTPGDVAVATALTIRYNRAANAFKGKAAAPRKNCQRGRDVTVKKVTPGPNRTVGQDTTNRFGNWVVERRTRRGRYYAVVTSKTFTADNGDTVLCRANRSVTIKIRPRTR